MSVSIYLEALFAFNFIIEISGPLFAVYQFGQWSSCIPGTTITGWQITTILSLLAAILVAKTTNSSPPVYHNVFAVLGFILSVPWIYFFVSQLNDLIKLFGMMFGLSDNFLGLTLLAWGNSIGDMVSNVTMAKRGSPRVGFSACFGGPPTNLLLGIGLPFTYHFIKEGINSASLGMIIMCVVIATVSLY